MLLSKRSARRKFVKQVTTKWLRYFRVTYDVGIKFEAEVPDDEGNHMPPFLRAEETVVTMLERAIIGEDAWAQMIRAKDAYEPKAMGSADVDQTHYGRASISFYDSVMNIEDDELFSLFITSVALHEVLHIVLSPLALYAESLETK